MTRGLWKIVIPIFSVLLCLLCLIACGDGGADAVLPEISGIVAPDVEVRYDGRTHTVNVYNTLDGDIVYYSESPNGEWSTQAPRYSLPAEYIIYLKVERAGFADLVLSARLTITRGVLQGISASDATFIYDGAPHGVSVLGVEQGDTVEYSLDGESFASECAVVDVGEYVVYYMVSNAYSDFSDECKLTILPDLSGRYMNPTLGVVTVARDVGYVGDDVKRLVYGLDGSGTLGDSPFRFSEGSITVDGARYDLLDDGKSVYRIKASDRSVFAAGGNTLEVSVQFADGAARVTADGKQILTVEDRNYCESMTGEFLRSYDSSDIVSTVGADGDITDIVIELSERQAQTAELDGMLIVYDGKPHAPQFEYAGVVLYKQGEEYVATPPEYIEIGVHIVEAVMLMDGYLPKLTTATIEIVPDISGVYFDAHTVIAVDKYDAKINGVTVACEYVRGGWHIADKLVSLTDDGLTIDGAAYEKATEGVVVIALGGEWNVLRSDFINLIVTVAEQITVTDEIGNVLLERACASANVTLKINGIILEPMNDEPIEYVIGTSDLHSQTVTVVEIVEQSRR